MASFIGRWTFNRGQSIALYKEPSRFRVSVWLLNTTGDPVVRLVGKDKERLLLRAINLVKKDISEDSQELYLIDSKEHSSMDIPLPFDIPTESQRLEAFAEEIIQKHGIGKIYSPSFLLESEFGPSVEKNEKITKDQESSLN